MIQPAERRSGEVWGALAAMLVALPSAIAFGLVIYGAIGPAQAAHGALAGILGTIALGLVAPLLGGTPRLISAPCAPAAAVMAALAIDLSRQAVPPITPALGADRIVALLTLAALLAAGLQFLFGVLGGGRVIKYIPYPVVSGYLSGVGALIFISQVPKLFGLHGGAAFWTGLASPGSWKWSGLIVGLVTIALMTAGPRLTREVPATILGLGGGVLAYGALSFALPELRSVSANPLVIGPIGGVGDSALAAIGGRWSALAGIEAADLQLILVPAATVAVLLSIDTLKTCVLVDALTRTRHNSNRELVGQGLGNLASAVVGGIPGAGVTGATLVNMNSGGTTRLSGVLEGVFALGALLIFGGLVAWIPVAALAGILIVVAFRMVDRNVVQLLKQTSTIFDFVVVAAVVVTAVAFNLIAAAGVGLGLAILLFLREQIRGSVVRRKISGDRIRSKKRRLPEEIEVLQKRGAQLTVCELQGSLFFGTTDQLFSELEADLKTRRYVILDMRRVQFVDFTATHMLKQIEAQLAERAGFLVFSDLPPNLPSGQDLETYFDQVGLVRPSRNVKVFDELDEALEWAEDEVLDHERLASAGEEAPLELAEINLVRGFDAETLGALGSCVRSVSCEPAQHIFTRGDTGDELYLIRRGTVRIVLPLAGGKQHHLVTFGRGDFFGDMAFLDRAPRSAEAVASTATDLFVLSRTRFDAVADKYPEMGRKVFARLARALAIRLRQTDDELLALKES